MDFSKAFDWVPQQRLLMKLRYYGIRGILNTWLANLAYVSKPDSCRCWVQVPGSASSIRGPPGDSSRSPLVSLIH